MKKRITTLTIIAAVAACVGVNPSLAEITEVEDNQTYILDKVEVPMIIETPEPVVSESPVSIVQDDLSPITVHEPELVQEVPSDYVEPVYTPAPPVERIEAIQERKVELVEQTQDRLATSEELEEFVSLEFELTDELNNQDEIVLDEVPTVIDEPFYPEGYVESNVNEQPLDSTVELVEVENDIIIHDYTE